MKTLLSLLAVAAAAGVFALDIQKFVSDAARSGADKAVIPEGVYRIKAPDQAADHLIFRNLNDFVIDCSGSTFIFESDFKTGLAFQGCRNLTFRNATLVNRIPPFAQGSIVRVSADCRQIDIKPHDGYSTEIAPGYVPNVLNVFDPVERRMKKNLKMVIYGVTEPVSSNLIRFHINENEIRPNTVFPGDMIVWRRHEGHEVAVQGCEKLKFTGVTIKNAKGAAVLEFGGEGGNYYNYTVTYAPAPEGAIQRPLLSGSADGFMSLGVKHGPTLENCLFEGLHDDAVNIASRLYFVLERSGNSIVIAAQHLVAYNGDEIGFYDFGLMKTGSARITSIEQLTDYQEPAEAYKYRSIAYPAPGAQPVYRLTFDRDTPAVQPGNYISNLSRHGDGFAVRNCTFKNKRGRGCLIRASGVIENNLFEDILGAAVDVMPEFYSFSEGPYAENLTVRNNVFRACNRGNCLSWTGTLNVYNWAGRYVPLGKHGEGHRNILIENNRFEYNDGPNIVLPTAEDVTIRNNRFIAPMTDRSLSSPVGGLDCDALIWAIHTRNLKLSGNTVQSPGPFLKKQFAAGPGVSVSGLADSIGKK